MGGKNLVHNCALSRSIGYFLEPLLVLGVFGKKPLSIRLRGELFYSCSFLLQIMHFHLQKPDFLLAFSRGCVLEEDRSLE